MSPNNLQWKNVPPFKVARQMCHQFSTNQRIHCSNNMNNMCSWPDINLTFFVARLNIQTFITCRLSNQIFYNISMCAILNISGLSFLEQLNVLISCEKCSRTESIDSIQSSPLEIIDPSLCGSALLLICCTVYCNDQLTSPCCRMT